MAAPPIGNGTMSFSPYQNTTNPSQSRTNFQGGASTAAANGPVYIKDANYAYMGPGGKTGKQDVLVPVAQAGNSFFFLDQAAKTTLFSKMDSWYGKGRWDPSWIPKFYKRAADASAYAYANAGQKLTPLDMFDSILQGQPGKTSAGTGARGGGGGGGIGVTESMQVASSVNLTDPSSARKLVDTALTNYLGRAATAQEQEVFQKALNMQERQSPTVTTQQSRTSAGGGQSMTKSMTETQGGFNPSTFAEEFARGQQGSGEYQAATTYLNTFIDALKARV